MNKILKMSTVYQNWEISEKYDKTLIDLPSFRWAVRSKFQKVQKIGRVKDRENNMHTVCRKY